MKRRSCGRNFGRTGLIAGIGEKTGDMTLDWEWGQELQGASLHHGNGTPYLRVRSEVKHVLCLEDLLLSSVRHVLMHPSRSLRCKRGLI